MTLNLSLRLTVFGLTSDAKVKSALAVLFSRMLLRHVLATCGQVILLVLILCHEILLWRICSSAILFLCGDLHGLPAMCEYVL